MYQNFDEKYVTINYDEGSSATVTQTTLAYWDLDYGKKLLTNDEQLNMYIKPQVSNAIKYLMLDNIKKLIEAKAFVSALKVEDALKNVKYNFYTKRNVRYTILFPFQFIEANLSYLNQFDQIYEEQLKIFEIELQDNEESSTTEVKSSQVTEKIIINEKEVSNQKKVINPKVYDQPNEFINDVRLETEKFEIEEEYLTEQKILNCEKESFKVPITKEVLPKKESKVIFREEDEEDFKDEINKEYLGSILESLELT